MSISKNEDVGNLQTRREWVKKSIALALASSVFDSAFAFSYSPRCSYKYFPANVSSKSTNLLPSEKKIPFDWGFGEISAGGAPVSLHWEEGISKEAAGILLRITSATDVREETVLEVCLNNSGEKIGELDVRYSHYMQPFELEIPFAARDAVMREGLQIKMIRGKQPFWFFSFDNSFASAPRAYLPHLLVYQKDNSPQKAFKQRFESLESVQSFGWMEGCVMDGLYEWSNSSRKAKKALSVHLDMFFPNNDFVYEGLRNERVQGRVMNVEALLPFAILAQERPSHAALQSALEFCRAHANSEGIIADGSGDNRPIKTEECYTVSYPLAVLAKINGDPQLFELAIRNLQVRAERLATDQHIFQRTMEQEDPIYRNWARGVGWYLLGLAKTLPYLPDSKEVKELADEFRRAAKWAQAYQQEDGLWYCFLDQAETGVDTSGSASIAASLAYGLEKGLLPASTSVSVTLARKGLDKYLTPDGFLKGTAQVNKGGEELQRNGYRVISPYTMGFLAHIYNP